MRRHLIARVLLAAAAAAVAWFVFPLIAGAKSCVVSHPYDRQTVCSQTPGACYLPPPPASLAGELSPVRTIQNSTHYNGSIRLDASALAWTDLDIEGNRMAVSWWGGLVLYQLATAGQATQLARLDGWAGMPGCATTASCTFPAWYPWLSELDQAFGAVAIPDGDPSWAVIAGNSPGGVALIDLGAGALPTPVVRYQDSAAAVYGTIGALKIGARSYAWAPTALGVYTYDLTQTRALGCERTCLGSACLVVPGPPCPGVRSVPFGGPAQYLAAVTTSAGRSLLVRSSGIYPAKSLEVWDVSLPLAPARVAQLAPLAAYGVAIWQHGDAAGTVYVAARLATEVRVYRLDGAALVDTGRAVPLYAPPESANSLPLSFSWSGDVPFVFAGHGDGCKELAEPVPAYDALIRLADPCRPDRLDLADVSPRQLVTIESWTSPGGPPTPRASRTVDYWGWWTPNHEWGWSSVLPRAARFSGDYLFRAAHTVGDIHLWHRPPASSCAPPPLFADGFESGSTAAWSATSP